MASLPHEMHVTAELRLEKPLLPDVLEILAELRKVHETLIEPYLEGLVPELKWSEDNEILACQEAMAAFCKVLETFTMVSVIKLEPESRADCKPCYTGKEPSR